MQFLFCKSPTPQEYLKDIWTSMFNAMLFIKAKMWKQPKWQMTDEWIKKFYRSSEILLSWEKLSRLASTLMELKGVGLCEVSQEEKDKLQLILLICGIWRNRKGVDNPQQKQPFDKVNKLMEGVCVKENSSEGSSKMMVGGS